MVAVQPCNDAVESFNCTLDEIHFMWIISQYIYSVSLSQARRLGPWVACACLGGQLAERNLCLPPSSGCSSCSAVHPICVFSRLRTPGPPYAIWPHLNRASQGPSCRRGLTAGTPGQTEHGLSGTRLHLPQTRFPISCVLLLLWFRIFVTLQISKILPIDSLLSPVLVRFVHPARLASVRELYDLPSFSIFWNILCLIFTETSIFARTLL